MTCRDYEDHSILLTRQLLAFCRQRGVAHRDELESGRRRRLGGELGDKSELSVPRRARSAQDTSGNGEGKDAAATWCSSFFFLLVFSTNSKYVWCLDLDLGTVGLATKPVGMGALGSNCDLGMRRCLSLGPTATA